MPRVVEMYAFVVTDENEDDEGIAAMATADGWLPMVGADFARAESLLPRAQMIAKASGKRMKLVRFAGPPEIVMEIE